MREGTALARDEKRSAPNIMDVVSADSMGRFPDANAAEALRRIPGVSLEIDQGEGRFVVVRGIDASLNNVTLNGQIVGTPAEFGTRGVSMDSVPADLISRLEVAKAVTPDMDAQRDRREHQHQDARRVRPAGRILLRHVPHAATTTSAAARRSAATRRTAARSDTTGRSASSSAAATRSGTSTPSCSARPTAPGRYSTATSSRRIRRSCSTTSTAPRQGVNGVGRRSARRPATS